MRAIFIALSFIMSSLISEIISGCMICFDLRYDIILNFSIWICNCNILILLFPMFKFMFKFGCMELIR